MRQQTLASQAGFERYGRKTRREQFLEEMEQVVPWPELEELVRPYYPKGENGRPPVGLSIMLRIYFLQQWFSLSDPGAEDALYESAVLRRFAGVDLGRAPAPDETTILNFRHLLEQHDLGGAMLGAVNQHLESRGLRIATGTIVDATIIHAPSSTKNLSGERDPAMHQTKKGQAVVLRHEGAYRCRCQTWHRALGVYDGGLGRGCAYAARPVARGGAQGVGRWRLSGTGRRNPRRRARGPGHDLPQNQIQRLRGRVTTREEPE